MHRTARTFTQPRWHGEPLEGRRILLHAEQGLGDTIQFSRYVSLVVARGGTAVLQVQQPVQRLMNSLAAARAGFVEVTRLGTHAPDPNLDPEIQFDLECPLMSLPAVFETTIDTVPSSGAYLAADPETIAAKRAQFPSAHPGPRIGVAWAGNPRYKADRQRSINLATLLPLISLPGFNWISLQKGEAAEQLSTLPSSICLADIHLEDGSSRDRDLAETAALLATLDLVITTDTCIAHLAGAMAKPVWIILPHLADWRWMQNLTSTPWYPAARLLRQKTPGDWPELVAQVAEQLTHINPRPSLLATKTN